MTRTCLFLQVEEQNSKDTKVWIIVTGHIVSGTPVRPYGISFPFGRKKMHIVRTCVSSNSDQKAAVRHVWNDKKSRRVDQFQAQSGNLAGVSVSIPGGKSTDNHVDASNGLNLTKTVKSDWVHVHFVVGGKKPTGAAIPEIRSPWSGVQL